MEKEPIIETPLPKKKSSPLHKIITNPWVWLVATIVFVVFVVIIFLIYKVVISLVQPEVPPQPKKQKPPKPVQQQPIQQPSVQQQPDQEKKEEAVSMYMSSPVETKVETSETEESHGDDCPKVEVIN